MTTPAEEATTESLQAVVNDPIPPPAAAAAAALAAAMATPPVETTTTAPTPAFINDPVPPVAAATAPPPAAEAAAASAAAAPTPASAATANAPAKKTAKTRTSASKGSGISPTSIMLQRDFPDFHMMFYKYMLYKASFENSPASSTALGTWIIQLRRCRSEQRSKDMNAPYLTEDRVKVLNSVNFPWNTQTYMQVENEKKWAEHYLELVKYKHRHGDCNVPQKDPKLGKWVHAQRDQYRNRQKMIAGNVPSKDTPNKRFTVLSEERLMKLEALGFRWTMLDKPRDGWDTWYDELKNYREVVGHCNVPQGYKDNVPLGRWVMRQRVHYHKKIRGQKSCMTDERIQKLEEIGFEWVGPGLNRKRKEQLEEEGQHHRQRMKMMQGGDLDDNDEVSNTAENDQGHQQQQQQQQLQLLQEQQQDAPIYYENRDQIQIPHYAL